MESARPARIRKVAISGKFLSSASTGVHRVAGQLITHLDALLAEKGSSPTADWRLVCPRDARRPLPLTAIERQATGRLTWQPWEQLELPIATRDRLLVNLCNLGPLAHPRSVTLIHDAQAFLTPESYSRAFAAWYRFVLPRLAARAVRILTVSAYSRDQLVRHGIATADRITVIPNGADHLLPVERAPCLGELGLEAGRYVLTVGSAQRHKNLRVVFDALRDPALSHLRLVVVGPADAAGFLAEGDRPPSGAVFAGAVSDGALRTLYENAVCLAFPSLTEGFGLPPVEAMALNCPVVAAPCGALPEVCAQAALYADPHDPADWRQAILSLSTDPTLRIAQVANGRARAAGFTWRRSAQQLEAVLEALR